MGLCECAVINAAQGIKHRNVETRCVWHGGLKDGSRVTGTLAGLYP